MVGPARLAENPAGNPVLYLALLKMCVFFLFLKPPEMGNLLGIGSISVAPLLQIQDHHSRFKRLKRGVRTTWLRNSTERDNIESNQRTRWEFQTFMCFQPWLG